jgi:peptidylprolyl isomerase
VRTIPALVITAGLVLSLGACGGGPAPLFGGCTPELSSGEASEQIEASGGIGQEPEVSFPTPLFADETQVTMLEEGEGDPLYPGQTVDFQLTAYYAESGDPLTASSYEDDNPVRRTIAAGDDVLGLALQCAKVDSRYAVITTMSNLLTDQAISENGLDPDVNVIAVVDVQRGFLGKANGADQLPQAGFPAIALAPNGQPGITPIDSDPPTDLKIEVLKRGGGQQVEEGDVVVAHYTGLVWGADDPFQSTWDTGVAASLTAAVATGEEDGVIEGFAEAIIGERVGSQIVVIVPPEFGYSSGAGPASIPDGSTLIFVIDILGIE